MADKVYVVTLQKRDDLDGFYSDMESDGFKLQMKRPISRNTHYYMTEDQAVELRKDSRVIAVELSPEEIPFLEIGHNGIDVDKINNAPYPHSGDFRKNGTYNINDKDWAKLHVAGDDAQRRKGSWGAGNVVDNAEVFNTGRHVDVVICDDPVSFDCEDWKSFSDNSDRFQMYDWYTELNSYVSSIDDDGTTLPTGSYPNYFTNNTNTEYHGNHVAGTIAGKHYGWAPDANIYSMQILPNASNLGTAVPVLLMFDYLRAFHRYKPINKAIGSRNPTITNHSWGYGSNLESLFDSGISIGDVGSVVYRGTTYSSSNPNPSGWTMTGLERDFGISAFKRKFNFHYAAINADVEDAIEDGVVVIGAAGNNDFYMASSDPTDPSYVDWNNTVFLNGAGTLYFQRGSSPCNAPGVINVGAVDTNSDFRRANFSNFGPRIDVWAPGVNIVSVFNNQGTPDGKYGGDNWYYPISGTSMASPQVAGVAACLATGKTRFTNSDVLGYIQQFGKVDDMTFDVSGGDFSDATCRGSNGGLFFDSDIVEIRSQKTRPDTGYMGGWYKDQLKGHRRHEEVTARGQVQLYPRVNQYYRPLPIDTLPQWPNATINVTTPSGSSHYTMIGDDRNGGVNANNPQLTYNRGDIISFVLNVAPSHPFWIKTLALTGTGWAIQDWVDGSTTYGVDRNGQATGTVTFYTGTLSAGTYYYICQAHSSMQGQIILV
mgnify:CR=1 FL=1|tara:strand:+ start:602 stop:2737 length:2136 start_codon:yes stop_codon:yes gene_type:complete